MRLLNVCLAVALVVVLSISLAAQTTTNSQPTQVKKVPAPYTDPTSGSDMFKAYCASCHGADGKGNGPAAAALKTPPADLTKLAAKNGGKFPDAQVMQVIKGDALTAAHGNKEMPVWGPVFLVMGHRDTASVQLRIRNLEKYLESIQQK
jgi:mono/diheme cytochrome c family protein